MADTPTLSRIRQTQRSMIAASALRASVEFASETMKIVDILNRGLPLQALQGTALIQTMRKRVTDMSAFIDELEPV